MAEVVEPRSSLANGAKQRRAGRWWVWVLLLLVLLSTAVIRIRLLSMPLERDEGEYAYAGQLMLQGIPPYKLAYNMKFPGTYGAYAFIMAIFGQTPVGIHLGFLFVNAAATVLMFLLTRRLAGAKAGLVAAALYSYLSLSGEVLGTSAHATHFVVLCALAGLWVLLKAMDSSEGGGSARNAENAPSLAPSLARAHYGLEPEIQSGGTPRTLPPSGTSAKLTLAAGERTSEVVQRGKPSATRRSGYMAFFLAGVFLGAAVLMKQHGAVYAAFAFTYLVYCRWRPPQFNRLLTEGAFLVAGILCPLLLTGLWLWQAGVFDKFWFWTIQYGAQYAAERPAAVDIIRNLVQAIPRPLYAVLYLGACGAVMLFQSGKRSEAVFGAGLLGFSFIGLFPNFNFRPHYFVMVLPGAAFLAGAAFSLAFEYLQARGRGGLARAAAAAFVCLLCVGYYRERNLFFLLPPDAASRQMYHGESAFSEAASVGEYLKAHTSPGQRIAILGSEPELYFHAHRLSATGYIYTYALMEPQPYALRMQEEMIREIESAKPEYVVVVHDLDSWAARARSETKLFDWSKTYVPDNFERVGLVERFPDRAEFRWDTEAVGRKPKADVYFEVFRRKA